jgi:hypothetical protein
MKRVILLILLCCSLLETKATVYEKADIAICADLSYSTKGLLDALRQNMWYLMHYLTVYNPQPSVRVGMMCYGKIGYGRENNYIRLVSDLSNRINAIQQEMYAMVNGEPALESFPELALLRTINELSWTKEGNCYKTIFFMGNGKLHSKYFNDIVKSAKKKGIIIHVMYYQAYNNQEEINTWMALCKELDVELQYINPAFVLPLEREIKSSNTDISLEANEKYNHTFIPYGEHGQREFNKFLELDAYAKQTGMHCQEFRLLYKVSNNYLGANTHWDLVDLSINGQLDTNKIERKYLPETYRNMSYTDLLLVINRKKEERMYLREIVNITSRRNVLLTHDYYQEYKAVIRKSLYIMLMQNINEDIDNVHLIME